MASLQTEKADKEELSRRLCRTLDGIGYNKDLIQFRSQATQHIAALLRVEHALYCIADGIIAGSKGEGISKFLESDIDVVYVIRDNIITTVSSSSRYISDKAMVFTIQKSHPGYCKLKLLQMGTAIDDRIFNSLVPYDEEWMLSSSVIKAEFKGETPEPGTTVFYSGPAETTVNENGYALDSVLSLNFDCHDILHEWYTRPRKNDWPPQHLRQAAHDMRGNLVPKGKHGSETEHLEWRFCFNRTELKLIESLNDTQIKLYKMLKMINTDILKPNDFGVTSYILKNIVFWLAETYPQSTFLPETLIYWIQKSLLLLKKAVKANFLPYYMIPERNLIKEKISLLDRKPLYDMLTVLSNMGPEIVLECKKVNEARYMTPRDLSLLQEHIYDFETAFYFQAFRENDLFIQKGITEKDDLIQDETYRLLENRLLYSLETLQRHPYIREKLNTCLTSDDYSKALLA